MRIIRSFPQMTTRKSELKIQYIFINSWNVNAFEAKYRYIFFILKTEDLKELIDLLMVLLNQICFKITTYNPDVRYYKNS